MKVIGIDLSLRSTGLVYLNDNEFDYRLIVTDSKKLNDEELLIHNTNEILKFINKYEPEYIALEGLSFGSVSSSKDIIAGNFWHLRTELFKNWSGKSKIEIIPVLTWRSPLFDKDERKLLKENTKELAVRKKALVGKSKEEKKIFTEENAELTLKSNIKYLTWCKLPEPIKNTFKEVGFTKGGFDLTDAYFIAKHIENKYA